jgi:hypothetical protein
MSQVNKFKQEQNPDYIYFDLQQTNVQNTTEFIQQPLKFVETRDAPIVANSGEYHLSVTRFQLDTYNLPVLVVEPDLTQPDATYNKNQTIYKVAMLATEATIASDTTQLYTEQLIEQFVDREQNDYGERIAMTGNMESLSIVIGRPDGNGGKGSVVFWAPPGIYAGNYTWTATGTTFMGKFGVGISNDERFLITNAIRTDSSGNFFGATLVWDRFRPLPAGVPNDPYVLETAGTLRGVSQISGDGTKIVRANYIDQSLSLYTFANGVYTKFGVDIDNSYTTDGTSLGQNGLAISSDGTTIVVSNKHYQDQGGEGAIIILKVNWAVPDGETTYHFTGANGQGLGHYVCMSSNGLVVAASGTGGGTPVLKIFEKTTPGGVTTWTQTHALSGGQVELGDRLSLNADGSVLFVATFSTRRVKRFKKVSGVYTYDITMAEFSTYSVNVASNSTGNKAYIVNWTETAAPQTPTEEEFLEVKQINAGDLYPLPSSIVNVPYIKPVIWRSDYKDAVAPEKNVLDGKNTALFQYYYCNAYENFIARVNIAIKDAYLAMIQDLYVDWVRRFNLPSLTNNFVDYVVRQYAPAPFLEWNEAELKADIYATLLFQTNYVNEENTINYSSNPDVVFSVVGSNRVGTFGKGTPFNFQLAMNAPLYSLFNSFPATKKVLTAPITLYRENYYIINFFTTGNDLITPSVPLHTPPTYPFVGTYYLDASGNISYPSAHTANIAHANLLIKQPQELSTIDTWTPINAIVFTTTSLPIIVNQFSASSSIGDKPPSGSTSNEFAFIITDIQSNDQGFRPNVLYTPTAEFRRIDLTGNQPIRNIDISIFWRSTTGALIPMVLASGAQASIKLLFEKKDKTNQKEANASALSTSIRDIV